MAKNKKEKRYVERDVSWMYFNHRILQEAQKENIPLLERLSFLGIYSNNLDEFSVYAWLRSAVCLSLIIRKCADSTTRYARPWRR